MSDILIVGAGPTGLVLAFELVRRGISVRLIDAKSGPEVYSRAMGIQSHTLEVFERMNILPPFLEAGKKAEGITFHYGNKQLQLSLKELDAPYPFVLILPQSDTEKILHAHLEKAGGAIEWETTFIGIENGEAVLEHASGEQERVAFPWIVGCDGAHSKVRQTLELPFHGSKIHETFLLADVQAQTPIPSAGPELFLSKKGFGLLIPFPDEQCYRIVCPGAEVTESPQRLSKLLHTRGLSKPFEISKIERVTSFQIQRRHSAHFRIGNVFLAGDAAHIHSPFGGQGMNTSIQDAFNLGWKLALVIQGIADPSLLETYEEERMPIAKAVLKGTTFMTRLLTFSQKYFPPLFYWGVRFLLGSKERREKARELVSELGVAYAPKKSDWKGPRVGERAPDSPLADGKRLFERMKGPKFDLLLFSENPEFVKEIEAEYGEWINVHVLKGEAVREKYAAEETSLYLIRPDGYVGFRSRHFTIEEVASYLLKVFLPASSRNKS